MRKILVEFRAGKVCRIGSRMSFDRRLGVCFMYEEDDTSLHFCWREYDTIDVEDDIIITPGNAKFKCVPSYTTHRVYQLVISNVENYYYWMQEPYRKDNVYCKTVNKILEDYKEKEMHKQEQLLESTKDKISTGMQPEDNKSHSDSEIILRSRTRKDTSLKSDLQQVFDELLAELRILNNEKTIFLQDYMTKQSSDDHTAYSNSKTGVDIKNIQLHDKEKAKMENSPSSSRLLKNVCIIKKKNENTVFRSNAKKDKNDEKYLQSEADDGAGMTKKNGQSEEE
ncbi:Proteasomal ubiquitin receptor [Trichinella pseudospiralis]